MNIEHIQQQIGTTVDGIWGKKSDEALRKALDDGVKIEITPNISLNELLASQTATRNNIDNIPDARVLQNLIDSAVNLWQPARDALGFPIRITSGYRSPTLNKKIGGAKNSAHLHGFAIDFVCHDFGSTTKVVNHLVAMFKEKGVSFDQAIIEYPKSSNSWVHLGYKRGDGLQRNSTFTIF